MTEWHSQSDETKSKIGNSVESSSWRRRSRDKPNEMQSSAGQWDEDYPMPSRGHHSRIGLWEETHNKMVWR